MESSRNLLMVFALVVCVATSGYVVVTNDGVFQDVVPRVLGKPQHKAAKSQQTDPSAEDFAEVRAEQGGAEAEDTLSANYIRLGAKYMNEGRPDKAISFLLKAATLGSEESPSSVEAQLYLGRIYEEGKIVARDYIESAKWFRLAADRGVGRLTIREARASF